MNASSESSTHLQYEPGPRDLFVMTYSGDIGSDDFYLALASAYRFPRKSEHYDVIFDVTRSPQPSLANLMSLRRAVEESERAEGMGLIVIVTHSSMMQTLFSAFTKLYPTASRRYRIASSVTEARTVITRAHSISAS